MRNVRHSECKFILGRRDENDQDLIREHNRKHVPVLHSWQFNVVVHPSQREKLGAKPPHCCVCIEAISCSIHCFLLC